MTTRFRPPAVPLITHDPYFNVWSSHDRLTDGETRHWTGKTHGMVGMLTIDGVPWRFMGGYDRRSDFPTLETAVMTQTNVSVEPLLTRYAFEGGGVTLTVEFLSPLLPDDLETLGRPASYLTFDVVSNDGKTHDVSVYIDLTAEWCVDVPIQEVTAHRQTLADGMAVLSMGTKQQPILRRSGDDLRIDWGYVCLAVPPGTPSRTAIGSASTRQRFAAGGAFPETDDARFPRQADDDMPVAAALLALGDVGEEPRSAYVVVAYDDIYAIDYFGERLPGYWKRNGQTREEMLQAAVADYPSLRRRCAAWGDELIREATASGGETYADLLSLACRQASAAHKLVADRGGNVLFFSKENFSNGCMATVDVSYPSIPMFLLYNVDLVKGMLRPVFRYAASEAWPYDFAPHDVGRYPLATGQAYGLHLDRQMPIEECGNMLIMTAAVCAAEGSPAFAEEVWPLLARWSRYLLEHGMDPGNQLCTDDFAGHLAHNANLSVKAIVGIACYGRLCAMTGRAAEAEASLEAARRMAADWEEMAREGDHYKLAFDLSGSWSLKYNLIWDVLFDFGLFPEDVRKKELAHYEAMQNRYGTPLDNRSTYTKADWLVWAATLSDDREQFERLIEPLRRFLDETVSRVPFTDWYYTIDGKMTGFVNRSVVGGLFIKLVADRRSLSKHAAAAAR